jgi:hypothetical protein
VRPDKKGCFKILYNKKKRQNAIGQRVSFFIIFNMHNSTSQKYINNGWLYRELLPTSYGALRLKGQCHACRSLGLNNPPRNCYTRVSSCDRGTVSQVTNVMNGISILC